MFRRTNTFLCAECNEMVPHPVNVKGVLRCPAGHRVDGLKSRPMAMEVAISLFAAFIASGILISLGDVFLDPATVPAATVAILYGAFSTYLLRRGLSYRRREGVVRQLSPQYLAAGGAFLFCALFIGAASFAGLYNW